MKLTNNYNRLFTQEELDNLCNLIGINLKQLLSSIDIDSYFLVFIKQTLKKREKIWIGQSRIISKDDLNNNAQFIIELAAKITDYFYKLSPFCNYEDIYDETLSIIIEKCGDLFINIIDKDTLTKCIWNKTLKTLKGIFWRKTKEQEYSDILNYNTENEFEDIFNIELKYPYLTKKQNSLLSLLSKNIELNVHDPFSITAQELEMTEENLMINIKEIITIIKQNNKVKVK